MKEKRFSVDLKLLRQEHRRGPEPFIQSVKGQIGPVLDFLIPVLGPEQRGGASWILTELVANAAVAAGYRAPGKPVGNAWLSASCDEASGRLQVLVQNTGKPSPGDHHQIARRFDNYAETRQEVEELRRKHTGKDGIVRVPKAKGSGALALLECIRAAREYGFHFDYWVEETPAPVTVFRYANFQLPPEAERQALRSARASPAH